MGESINSLGNSKIRIGVLGCGRAAKNAIPAFKNIENAELMYVASRDLNKAKEWAKNYGVSYAESYEDLLKRKDVDAIYIAVPPSMHEEWAVKAAKAKKHIICEKPISDSLKSAKNIVESCRSHDVILYENVMCGFHPQHAKVSELMKSGEIGKVFVFEGYYCFSTLYEGTFRASKELGGGSLNDMSVYPVFISRKLFESEPISVSCNLVYDPKTKVDVHGTAYLEFPNNKSGFLVFALDSAYTNNYTVFGTRGKIISNRAYSIPGDMKPSVQVVHNDTKETITEIDINKTNHFELIFYDFCNTILSNDKNSKNRNYDQILNQARVMEAMRMSARENRRVRLDEVGN